MLSLALALAIIKVPSKPKELFTRKRAQVSPNGYKKKHSLSKKNTTQTYIKVE